MYYRSLTSVSVARWAAVPFWNDFDGVLPEPIMAHEAPSRAVPSKRGHSCREPGGVMRLDLVIIFGEFRSLVHNVGVSEVFEDWLGLTWWWKRIPNHKFVMAVVLGYLLLLHDFWLFWWFWWAHAQAVTVFLLWNFWFFVVISEKCNNFESQILLVLQMAWAKLHDFFLSLLGSLWL